MSETILDHTDHETGVQDSTSNKLRYQEYPGVSERFKAALVDAVLLVLVMFLLAELFDGNDAGKQTKMIIFICLFGLYDPLFTSLFGGTLGHLMSGLRVKRHTDQERNIFFPLGIIRFIFKFSLGWISLLTVGSNKESRAIHDLVAGSVVVSRTKK